MHAPICSLCMHECMRRVTYLYCPTNNFPCIEDLCVLALLNIICRAQLSENGRFSQIYSGA